MKTVGRFLRDQRFDSRDFSAVDRNDPGAPDGTGCCRLPIECYNHPASWVKNVYST
jgi:hypothetical protein